MGEIVGAEDWDSLARNLLRGELMGRGMSYAALVDALAAIGIEETEASIKNKVSRGRFPLTFFLQAMVAIGEGWVRIPSAEALQRGEGLGQGGAQTLARRRREPDGARD